MKNSLFFWFVVGSGLLWALTRELICWKRLRKYWSRSCMGREWRRRFPDSPKEDIRAFLEAFVDGFCFSSRRRLKFGPADKVMDIYGALYPPGSLADSMELGCFAMNLERAYGEDFSDRFTPDTTLGDIFEMVRDKGDRSETSSVK